MRSDQKFRNQAAALLLKKNELFAPLDGFRGGMKSAVARPTQIAILNG
jgi:hypothetical protein